MRNFRSLVLGLVLVSLAGVSWSDVHKEAVAAFQRGDSFKAFTLWKPLAEAGDATAQNNIGALYRDGQGVVQDYREAVRWYRLAAEQGLAHAQSNLASQYAHGIGVIEDDVYAHMWFNIAASNGNEAAREK